MEPERAYINQECLYQDVIQIRMCGQKLIATTGADPGAETLLIDQNRSDILWLTNTPKES